MALCSPSLPATATKNSSRKGASSLPRLSPRRWHHLSPVNQPASCVWIGLPDKSHRLEPTGAFPTPAGCDPRSPAPHNARTPPRPGHDNASGHCHLATHQSPIPHLDDAGGLGGTPPSLSRVALGCDARLCEVYMDAARSEPVAPGCPACERPDRRRHAQSCPPSAFAASSSPVPPRPDPRLPWTSLGSRR